MTEKNPDGTEEIIKTSVATDSGVTITLEDGATIKIVDNSKNFNNVATDIIVYQHWGTMNSSCVRKKQIQEAQYMAENGADLLVGSHPHVVQRCTYLKTSTGKKVPCAYSLGNFMSSMTELLENRESALLKIELTKDEDTVTAQISYISLEDRLRPLQEGQDYLDEKRQFIARCEDIFIRVTGCYVLDISKYYYSSDRFPLGGAHIVHYEENFYKQACGHILEILQGTERRVYDECDAAYIFQRDMKLNRP